MKTDANDLIVPCDGSLTKREYFAVMAMKGLLACSITGGHKAIPNLSREALEYADALIKELNKESK